MAVVTIQQSVAALYVAVFNRAADAAGLNAWTAAITSGKQTFAQVAAGFAAHEVFTAGIGTLNNTDFVSALYQNILGSAGDAAGIANWAKQLNAGVSKADVAALFVQAALTVDIPAMLAAGSLTAAEAAAATVRQQTLTNKADVGIYFANTLGAASNLDPKTVSSSKAGLEADPIYNASKAAIANVTNTAASVKTAKDAIAVAAGSANPAQALLGGTFSLTVGEDKFVGGAGNDTFNALVIQDNSGAAKNTLENIDQLDGGAGIDTLNATISGGDAATTLKNIENVNVRFATANQLDLANSTGVTNVAVANSTNVGTVAGVGSIANLAVNNQTQNVIFAGNTATTLNLALDTVGKATAATTVTLADTATTLNVTANNAYVTTSTVGAAKTLNVAVTGANVLTLAGTTATTATVTGTGSVDLKTAFTTLTTLNASANTGGVTATVDGKAVTVNGGTGADKITYSAAIAATAKVDLGAGNDTLTLGAASLKGAVVNGGEGTDTLAVTGAFLDADSKAIYTGFEVLQVSNNTGAAIAFDPTLVNGITSYNVAASAAQVGLINLAAAPTVNVIGSAADLVLTLKDATGAADVANVTLNNGVTTAVAGVTYNGVAVTKLGVAGVETLNIHSNGLIAGTAPATNSVILDTLTTSKVVIDGSQAISFTTGAHSVDLIVDASAATGSVTVKGALATQLLNVNGGAGNDNIEASIKGGLIYGAAGGDDIKGGAGADTLIYKAASDSLVSVKADGSLETAKMDVVTTFTSASDKIDLTSLGFSANTQKVVLEKTVAASDAALLALANTATFFQDASGIARGVVAVSNGADTYVFADANKDGVFSAATDLVIKVSGAASVHQADVIFG